MADDDDDDDGDGVLSRDEIKERAKREVCPPPAFSITRDCPTLPCSTARDFPTPPWRGVEGAEHEESVLYKYSSTMSVRYNGTRLGTRVLQCF